MWSTSRRLTTCVSVARVGRVTGAQLTHKKTTLSFHQQPKTQQPLLSSSSSFQVAILRRQLTTNTTVPPPSSSSSSPSSSSSSSSSVKPPPPPPSTSSPAPSTSSAGGGGSSGGGGGIKGVVSNVLFLGAAMGIIGYGLHERFDLTNPAGFSEKASKIYTKICDEGGMAFMRFLPPETAHHAAVLAVGYGLGPRDRGKDDEALKTTVAQLEFPNAVGLAAGFDKHAEAVDGLIESGFGFVEIGSVTPEPQPGNPQPRMFRLTPDKAVINRCGFNSDGINKVAERLEARVTSPNKCRRRGLVGINAGKNKTTLEQDAASDYCKVFLALGRYADYLVVNVSSPNTPGLRALQRRGAIEGILEKAARARDEVKSLTGKESLPLFVKIAPDLDQQGKEDIAAVALTSAVDGLIVSNTTISRPDSLVSKEKDETGGLSGEPLRAMAHALTAEMYFLTKGKVPIISVGGISNGTEAYERILSGASLVQIYTAMIFEGPGLVQKVKEELAEELHKNGYTSVTQAVGVRTRQLMKMPPPSPPSTQR